MVLDGLSQVFLPIPTACIFRFSWEKASYPLSWRNFIGWLRFLGATWHVLYWWEDYHVYLGRGWLFGPLHTPPSMIWYDMNLFGGFWALCGRMPLNVELITFNDFISDSCNRSAHCHFIDYFFFHFFLPLFFWIKKPILRSPQDRLEMAMFIWNLGYYYPTKFLLVSPC